MIISLNRGEDNRKSDFFEGSTKVTELFMQPDKRGGMEIIMKIYIKNLWEETEYKVRAVSLQKGSNTGFPMYGLSEKLLNI